MSKKVLALYDILGIQQYIFQTSRLKDIIGASRLVAEILTQKRFDEIDKNAELIYSGGGNAILSFEGKEEWIKFNRKFSRYILSSIPELSFATICNEDTEGKIEERIQDMFSQMAKKKNVPNVGCSFTTLPPMAQSGLDNQQVSFIDEDGKDLSFATWVKRQRGEEGICDEKFKEFDEIAKPPENISKAERLIALVHIDGNQMGNALMDYCKKIERIDQIKEFSDAIDKAFKGSLENVKAAFPEMPIRIIYVNGDDVTYVCHSAYALASVKRYMDALQEYKKDGLESLSASAGIAYIKPHFPFYKAYNIAEACCKNAKDKARKKYTDKGLDIGCWVDYAIVRGSGSNDKMQEHFLHPYSIYTPDKRDNDRVSMIIALLKDMKKSGMRSNLKDLRNAFLLGDMESVVLSMKSLGQTFEGRYILGIGKIEATESGKFDFELDASGKLSDGTSPIFDALDLMDVEGWI